MMSARELDFWSITGVVHRREERLKASSKASRHSSQKEKKIELKAFPFISCISHVSKIP